jgi:membrane associated rhomboid family serine protease
MFPLKDDIPSQTTPVVTMALIAINIVVFLYQVSLQVTGDAGASAAVQAFVFEFGAVPCRISGLCAAAGDFPPPVATIFTSMFLHGGWAHILGNMLFLWIFGDNVEAAFGHLGYLLFYFVCGIGSGLVHAAFNLHSHLPAVGASGAISGVLGAYIVLEPRNRILSLIFIFVVRVPAVVVLGVWFAMQFLMGLSTLGATANVTGGVAVWAHIGGFLIGLVVALAVKHR